jgi:hypothetical protein
LKTLQILTGVPGPKGIIVPEGRGRNLNKQRAWKRVRRLTRAGPDRTTLSDAESPQASERKPVSCNGLFYGSHVT